MTASVLQFILHHYPVLWTVVVAMLASGAVLLMVGLICRWNGQATLARSADNGDVRVFRT